MLRRVIAFVTNVALVSALFVVVSPSSASAAVEPGRILFESEVGANCGGGCLYTMNPDGSNRTVVSDDLFATWWTWSPHGNYIATDRGIIEPDGSGLTNLGTPGSVRGLSWSPDGWTIAVSARDVIDPDNTQDIYLVGRDGKGLKRIVGLPSSDEVNPSWSPDGTQLTFASNRDGWDHIFVVNADGSGLKRITSGNFPDTLPEWSPKGDRIIFVRDTNPGGFPATDLFTVSPDGGPIENLTNSALPEVAPSWSPDGSQVLFHAYDGEDFDVFRMNADGSSVVNLTHNSVGDFFPVWAPKRTGKFQGLVTGLGAPPVDHGKVEVWTSTGSYVDTYVANKSGGYETDLLPPNRYQALMYNGTETELFDYFPTWYQDAPLLRFDLASDIKVSQGLVTGINVALHPFFDDMFGSTFIDDIAWMQYSGVTKGCNPPVNDLYCPDDLVTRGQMAAFLVRALGYSDDGGGDLFIDDDGSTFERDIDRLGTAGVTRGCNPPVNDRFCPDDFVTRGQMAAFLVRAMHYVDDGGGDLFIDDDSSVFEGDIDRLGTAGVTRGCNPPVNDRFCPSDFVTRGQMAAFVHRALTSAFPLQTLAVGSPDRWALEGD